MSLAGKWWKRNKKSKIIILILIVSIIAAAAYAHPGRTDGNGGHTCRTNCEKWGLEDGEYHYHNKGSDQGSDQTTPVPTATFSPTVAPTLTATPTAAPTISPTPTEYVPFDRAAIVTSIVDGDTVYVDSKEKVRFVGVNTPEIGTAGALEAKNYVADRIKGKQIYLDVDNKKTKDKYGRTLAVILIDGENLNKELLCKGYAEVMYIPPSEFDPNSWKDSCSLDQPLITAIPSPTVTLNPTPSPTPQITSTLPNNQITPITNESEMENKGPDSKQTESNKQEETSWLGNKINAIFEWLGW